MSLKKSFITSGPDQIILKMIKVKHYTIAFKGFPTGTKIRTIKQNPIHGPEIMLTQNFDSHWILCKAFSEFMKNRKQFIDAGYENMPLKID